jgi:hypothetical protein
MTQSSDDSAGKTPAEKMAEMVARKAAARNGHPGAQTGGRQAERAAAALSASKSKPAMRKG